MHSLFKNFMNKLRTTFKRGSRSEQGQTGKHSSSQNELTFNLNEGQSQSLPSKNENEIKKAKLTFINQNECETQSSEFGMQNEQDKQSLDIKCLALQIQSNPKKTWCFSSTSSPVKKIFLKKKIIKTQSGKSPKSGKSNKSNKSPESKLMIKNYLKSTSSNQSVECAEHKVQEYKSSLKSNKQNVSCQNSNETISSNASSFALLFGVNNNASKFNLPAYSKINNQVDDLVKKVDTFSTYQNIIKNDSIEESSSHQSSLSDGLNDMANLSMSNVNIFYENTNKISLCSSQASLFTQDSMNECHSNTSSHQTEIQANVAFVQKLNQQTHQLQLMQKQQQQQQQQQPIQQQQNQPQTQCQLQSQSQAIQQNLLLISQSVSVNKSEYLQLTDTDSELNVDYVIDTVKGCRSNSLDAILAKNMSRLTQNSNQRCKPRSSTPFLEIPKWRLFVRKPSNIASTLTINNVCGSSNNLSNLNSTNHTNQTDTTLVSNRLTDIFKDCVHCKIAVINQEQIAATLNLNECPSLTSGIGTSLDSKEINVDADDESEEDNLLTEDEDQDENYCSKIKSNIESGVSANIQSDFFPSMQTNQKMYVKNKQRRSSYNVTYFTHTNNVCTQIKKSKLNENNVPALFNKPTKQSIQCLTSSILNEFTNDEDNFQNKQNLCGQQNNLTDLPNQVNKFSCTPYISIEITEPNNDDLNDDLDDPGSGITVVSLEVPVLANSNKQARSASVDSSFLKVPPRSDIGNIELPPTKSARSRSVDIALPVGPDGPYLVVPTIDQKFITTK